MEEAKNEGQGVGTTQATQDQQRRMRILSTLPQTQFLAERLIGGRANIVRRSFQSSVSNNSIAEPNAQNSSDSSSDDVSKEFQNRSQE